MRLQLSALLALCALGTGASAQFLNTTVGPDPAPLGCGVSITISNDNPFILSTGPCPFEIYDDQMNLVFKPTCLPAVIDMGPYGWWNAVWNQTDMAGQQVPPGTYYVRVTYDVQPATLHPVQVGGIDANLVFEGTATIGQPLGGAIRNFYLCSPLDGGFTYFLLASSSATTGIPTCAGTFPLDPSPLLTITSTPNTVFLGSLGTFPPNGVSKTPKFPLPPDSALVGLAFESAFAVLDLTQPCPIRRLSPSYPMTIIG